LVLYGRSQETDMIIDDRFKQVLAKRMRDAVANPPQRVIARDLLARGLTPNQIHQLVVLDHAFDGVPYAFRLAIANAAREPAAASAPAQPPRPGERRLGHP
jgi:hypothetical protein